MMVRRLFKWLGVSRKDAPDPIPIEVSDSVPDVPEGVQITDAPEAPEEAKVVVHRKLQKLDPILMSDVVRHAELKGRQKQELLMEAMTKHVKRLHVIESEGKKACVFVTEGQIGGAQWMIRYIADKLEDFMEVNDIGCITKRQLRALLFYEKDVIDNGNNEQNKTEE